MRADGLVSEFRNEIIPDETVLFIDEWESAVGIPDDCFDGQGTIADRRRNVLAKLASFGVQTSSDFVDLAAFFGVPAVVKGGSTHGLFPFEFPMVFFPDERTARHTILIDLGGLTNVFPYTFRATAAEDNSFSFGSPEISLIKCLFEKLKPAHCDILYMDF